MNSQDLFDAVTALPDELIEEASACRLRRSARWKRWAAAAAILALVAAVGSIALPRLGVGLGARAGGMGNAGGKNGYTYMHYVGPVLPLTAMGSAQGVTAERSVDYDFSPYRTRTERYTEDGTTYTYDTWQSEAGVTDRYLLRNETDSDRALTLLYPVELSFRDPIRYMPVITVDGSVRQTQIHAAPYSGGFRGAWGGDDPAEQINLAAIDSWEGYEALLRDGSYQASAFEPFPVLDLPVTVYRLDDYVVAPTDAVNPSLQISFTVDPEKTAVMTYGSNGGTDDPESGRCSRIVGGLSYPNRFPMYLILLGEDIDGYTLQGYENMGANVGEEIDVSASVTRYETTLDTFVRQLLDEWITNADFISRDGSMVAGAVPMDMLVGAAEGLLASYGAASSDPVERYEFGMLEDLTDAFNMGRVMYLSFEVTVPAGGSVQVSASMRKDGSTDFIGNRKNTEGYDLAVRLGSTLTFTGQRASVSGTEHVEILENSFGFDPDHGVTAVTLDLEETHYWMQVRKRP